MDSAVPITRVDSPVCEPLEAPIADFTHSDPYGRLSSLIESKHAVVSERLLLIENSIRELSARIGGRRNQAINLTKKASQRSLTSTASRQLLVRNRRSTKEIVYLSGGLKPKLPLPAAGFSQIPKPDNPSNGDMDELKTTASTQAGKKNDKRSTLFAETQKLKSQEKDEIKKKKLIMLPDSIFRMMWDTVWVILYLAECLFMSVPMCTKGNNSKPMQLELIVMLLSTCFFLLTIGINFRTATLDGWTLIDDSVNSIATRYVKSGGVFFDLIIAFPFDLLCLSTSVKAYRTFSVLRIFKIVRFKRGKIGQPFSKSNPLVDDTAYSETIKISFIFLISVHIIASICLLIISNEVGSFTGAYLQSPETERDMWHDYGYALYWSLVTMTTVGYGDVTPLTTSSRYVVV